MCQKRFPQKGVRWPAAGCLPFRHVHPLSPSLSPQRHRYQLMLAASFFPFFFFLFFPLFLFCFFFFSFIFFFFPPSPVHAFACKSPKFPSQEHHLSKNQKTQGWSRTCRWRCCTGSKFSGRSLLLPANGAGPGANLTPCPPCSLLREVLQPLACLLYRQDSRDRCRQEDGGGGKRRQD